MCGRFAQYSQHLEQEILAQYAYLDPRLYVPQEGIGAKGQTGASTSYNVAPRDVVRVLRRTAGDFTSVLQPMKWGVIPRWAKQESKGQTSTTHNARSDVIMTGTSVLWKNLIDNPVHRCIVPVNGYFAWTQPPPGRKNSKTKTLPYYIKYKDNSTMLFAGLWEWARLEGDTFPTFTFTIITTESSEKLAFLGDRMPVILEDEDDVKNWLNVEQKWCPELQMLLRTYEDAEERLELYPVPPEMGNARFNKPSCVKPLKERADGIDVLFKRQAERKAQATQAAAVRELTPPPEVEAGPASSQTVVVPEGEEEIEEIAHVVPPGTLKRPIELSDEESEAEGRPTKRARVDKGKAPMR